jgi:protein-S-isoprenylcysteine O-methyltransferase Ste14
VRHPSYSGALLAALGVALCHLSPGTWLVECAGLFEPQNRRILAAVWAVGSSVICAALTSRMRKEDAMLQKNFGREWDEWAARVPYKIIPGLY